MSIMSEQSVRRILEAALTLFARHGFKRSSMADIAREAGVARATLYLRFADKSAVFEALAGALVDDALSGAAAAWREAEDLESNLAAMILAKDLRFFRLLRTTPHGAELLDLDADLAAKEARRLDDGFSALLVRQAEAAEEAGADVAALGGPEEFAAFLAVTAAGLKYETRTEAAYLAAVRRLARAAAAAVRSSKPQPAARGPAQGDAL